MKIKFKIIIVFILLLLNLKTFAQSWNLLISPSAYDTSQLNFSTTAFKQDSNVVYSVYKIGTSCKIQAFNLKYNTVTTISTTSLPSIDYNPFTFDKNNNRLIAARTGRENLYAVSASGGSWATIGTGTSDAESYGAQYYWNSHTNKTGFFGGYGYFYTKNWIWESNGTWSNPYVNNTLCNISNPAKRIGGLALGAPSSNKIYLFSGYGSCSGYQMATSCSLGSPWATDVGVYCWLKDLWQLDLTTYTFTNILPVNNTTISKEGNIVYDYHNNTFYIVGGFTPPTTYSSSWGSVNDYETGVLRFRVGIDTGFVPFLISGSPPPTKKINTLGPNAAFFDSSNNQIVWARKDGIWSINLTSGPLVITPVTYCQGTLSTGLFATKPNITDTLFWYTSSSGGIGSKTAPTPSTAIAGTTSYWVSAKNVSNIEGPRSIINVVVNRTPNKPIVTTPVTYCQGETAVALTATKALASDTLLWYTSASGGIGSRTAPTPSTATVGITTYWVSAKTNLNCEGPRDSINVVVNHTPNKPIVTTPVTYCQGETAVALTATKALASDTLFWYTSASGGIGSRIAPTPLTSTVGKTTYWVSAKSNLNCEGPGDSIDVVVNRTPSVTIKSLSTTGYTYCDSNTITLKAYSGTAKSYQWFNSLGIISGATYDTINIGYSDNVTIRVTNAEFCTKDTTVRIIKDSIGVPYPILSPTDAYICEEGSLLLTCNPGFIKYSFEWLKDGILMSPSSTGSNLRNVNTAGNYNVIVSNIIGCQKQTNTSMVRLYPKPIKPKITISGAKLVVPNLYRYYQWYRNNTVLYGANAHQYTAPGIGKYYIEISDANGCIANSDTVNYELNTKLAKTLINDKICISPNPTKNAITITAPIVLHRIVLFNTLGQLIFESKPGTKTASIDMSIYPAGMYILKLNDEWVEKIIKE